MSLSPVAVGLCVGLRPGDIIVPLGRRPPQEPDGTDHNSHTGLALKDGRYVAEGPGFYLKQMVALFDGRPVCDFQLTTAVSANPIIRFPFKVTRAGTLRVVFVNSEGQRWEVSQGIRV